MTVSGRAFSVVGMGRSGLAAARALALRGADVLLSDREDSPELRQRASSLPSGVQVVLGREVIRPGDTVVLSPGIPPSASVFREAHRAGGEVMGEVELFYRLWPGRIVAVTGTDGKSTVTTLIAHMLEAGGVRAHAAGNLGNALCDLLAGGDGPDPSHVVVAEVSCFQLVTVSRFRPLVAVVTNVAQDHIEYHGSFEAYVRAKARVVMNQAAGDWFVRNRDDPILSAWLKPGQAIAPDNGQTILEVSRNGPVVDGAWSWGRVLHTARSGRSAPVVLREEFCPIGAHNEVNALLAMAACLPFGLDEAALAKGLRSYRGLPHRIEFVREVGGVRFYNDSKATNPHAAATALRAFDEPVVLIAGGYEKGLPLDPLLARIPERCAAVVLCGGNAERMAQEVQGLVPVEVVQDLEVGVERALERARALGVRVVLFSPAASSYDRYHGFEERGEHFRRVVEGL